MSSTAQRYQRAVHRIQSCIAFTMLGYPLPDTHEASPKHLRVGVDSALASNEGLAQLLVDKGIVTAEEVAEAITVAAEKRADERVAELRKRFPGVNVDVS